MRGASMRRFFASAVLVLGLLTVGVASASADEAATLVVSADSPLAADFESLGMSSSAGIHGVGGGRTDGGFVKFDLSAHTGPHGDFGQVKVTQTGPTGQLEVSYWLDVECVHIHGPAGVDRGVIRGFVRRVSPSPNMFGVELGDSLIVLIKDGGNPSGQLPVDDFVAPHIDILAPVSCKNLFWVGDVNNVTQGNVAIKLD
jgi:hypothetical protein